MATVHHFLYMRLSEGGFLTRKLKPGSEGGRASHVVLTEKALAQCASNVFLEICQIQKKLQTCLDLYLETLEIARCLIWE